MRTLKKIGLTIVFLSFVIGCDSTTDSKYELEDFIPGDPSIVVSIANIEILQNDLDQNEVFKNIEKNELHRLLSGEHAIVKLIKPKSKSLIGLYKKDSANYDFTLVTKQDSTLFSPDSIGDVISETLSYGEVSLNRVQIENETAFTMVRDSFFLISSSQQLLQETLSEADTEQSNLSKVIDLGDEAELLIIRNKEKIRLSDSLTEALADQLALNISIAADGIRASGVALNNDTLPQLIDVFKGQNPQTNAIAAAHPVDAETSLTFTFNNPDSLFNNLKTFRADFSDLATHPIFETITEVCDLQFKNDRAIIMHSIDAALTNEALIPYLSENSSFRDVDVYDFSNPEIFINQFAPLVNKTRPILAFRLEQFFVFTESMLTAEKIITGFKSNNVLMNSTFFKNASRDLATASSMLLMQFNDEVSRGIANAIYGDMDMIRRSESLKDYRLSALQFSYDRNFAHVNYVCTETVASKQITGSVTQVSSNSLDTDVLIDPQFFSNHRTGGKDIVVQDMANKLHLLSSNGKLLWSKNLQDPVLGKIHEVDILRNGKKQLAFTTKNKLHVIDRNGNTVKPFPINFKDEITQPLSVFDYDNNRKYRFAIVQDEDVLLYDSKGKIVTGFKFKGAGSKIVLPVQHMRMGNKDYILVAEEKGRLHVLSRVGKSRISIDKRFKFSDIPIAEEGSNFVVITSNKTKESISQRGKVSSQKLNVSDSYSFNIDFKTKVTLDDNLLRINGILVELPFGIYTQPALYRANRQTYITLTETQENKVYVYNTSGELISGFPIYGTSTAEIAGRNRTKSMRLLVKGENNEVILYEVQ
ncbi:MAG: hypothetical protein HKO61_09690 [Flavobacteriaceae bacterium]|nr:hypothetical protein [Flavobacteriaceae bacterium]